MTSPEAGQCSPNGLRPGPSSYRGKAGCGSRVRRASRHRGEPVNYLLFPSLLRPLAFFAWFVGARMPSVPGRTGVKQQGRCGL